MNNMKRRSSQSIWILLVLGISLLCSVIIYIGFYAAERKYSSTLLEHAVPVSEKLTREECLKVCDTKECVEQSKRLFNNMKATVEPCENFYNFACGGFNEKADPDKSSTFLNGHLSQTRNKLKKFLDNLEASPESSSGKLKTVYDSCMKYGSSEKETLSTFLKILKDFGISDWPHLNPDYKFLEPSIAGVISNLLLYQEYALVYYSMESTEQDPKNPQKNLTVSINDRSSYATESPELRKHFLVRILKYFNLDVETIDEIWKDSEDILNAIQGLEEESGRNNDEDENSQSLFKGGMECTEESRGEWEELCESLESYINYTGVGEKVNKNYANIPESEYYFMKNVFRVLGNFSDRSVANYLVLNVFMNHLNELGFYFRLLSQDPRNVDDLNSYDHHWEHCVDWIINHMTLYLAQEYIQDGSTATLIKEVQGLTEELIQEMKDTVSRQDWIPDIVLENIVMQVENIDHTQLLAAIRYMRNATLLNSLYEEFKPSKTSFLLNAFKFRRFKEVFRMRGVEVEVFSFLAALFVPGASGGGGSITINPGILLPPVYTPRLERLINLVSLGTMAAHEIGHNVDFFIHQMKAFNKSAKGDHYFEMEQCLNKQFSEFRIESLGKNIEGSKHIVENVADNMAVTIIDKLIKKYVANGTEISLPGHPYSTEQLLYISSAQNWCSVSTKESAKEGFEKHIHSPMNFRLIGMMQNSKGFADAFNCPEGSYMHPSIKCAFLIEND